MFIVSLINYIEQNNLEEIVKLVNGFSISSLNLSLIISSQKGRFELVKFFINKKADINSKDSQNYTALIEASREGHFEIVKYLVERGASVNEYGLFDITALYIAVCNNHIKIVKYLVKNNAVINDNNWFSILMCACQKGHFKIAKCLIKHGALINIIDYGNNGNAVLLAFRCKYFEIVLYLQKIVLRRLRAF